MHTIRFLVSFIEATVFSLLLQSSSIGQIKVYLIYSVWLYPASLSPCHFVFSSFFLPLSPNTPSPSCFHAHTSIPPFSVSLSVSMLPPCLRLSLPLFAFNSWGHPGPPGSYPRMLSRLTSCGAAFWTERTAEPGLHRRSDSAAYRAAATPRKTQRSSKGSLL